MHNRGMALPHVLADRPGALLVRAARTGQELAARRLAPLGLTVQMCGVLILLGEGPISQHALGEQLGIDRTTVVELIDDLEKKGVVERRRNPEDRRSYALSLTPRGRTVQKQAVRTFDAAADELLKPLKASERRVLVDLLRRTLDSADHQLRESSA